MYRRYPKKVFRQPYRESRAFDMTCRNHGSCSWCEGNRLYGSRRAAREADQEIREYLANPHAWEDEDEWEEDYWFEDYMPYDDVIDIDDWRWSLEDDEW